MISNLKLSKYYYSLRHLSALEKDTSGNLEKKFVSLSHKRLLWRSRMLAWKGFHLPTKALQCGALSTRLSITTPLSSGYLETIVILTDNTLLMKT